MELGQMWQIQAAPVHTSGGDGPPSGPGTNSREGYRRRRRLFAGLQSLLASRKAEKGFPRPVAVRQMFCRSGGEAFTRKTRKSLVGQLVETRTTAAELSK